LEEKRKKTLEFKMPFLGWWKGKIIQKKVEDRYHKMELVIRKEVKYVLLKMSTFYYKYLLAFEIWCA
jgi:hypothetical protein